MATLSINERVVGNGLLLDTTTNTSQALSPGTSPVPARSWALASGTGSGQANQWYAAQRTVAGTTADNLDLAGGLSNLTGTVTLTAVKRIYVALATPDGTANLQVGPRGVANAFQGPWGGTAAGNYLTVYEELDLKNQYAGWTVTAGTGDILGVYNPTANSVTYFVWIVGVQ